MPLLGMSTATAHAISPPELQELLLPVLACLPTAFLSPKPPPSLLPLLSPILRQRIHLFASSGDQNDKPPSQRETWLSLLTWNRERASGLADAVSRMQLEAHPVSGEVELFTDTTDPDAGKVWYRQLDAETTQARCNVQEHMVGFVWVWCDNDTGGTGLEEAIQGRGAEEAQSGWRITEVVPLEGDENLELEGWSETLESAIQNGSSSLTGVSNSTDNYGTGAPDAAPGSDDGDADYWAAYDRTPGPGSRAPSTSDPRGGQRNGLQNIDSDDYFARYANEVQPAMDAHDPDEEHQDHDFGPSERRRESDSRWGHSNSTADIRKASRDRSSTLRPEDFARYGNVAADGTQDSVPTTTAQEPASQSVAALEASAASSDAVETTIRQHISGEIKHLYRLARGVGIEQDDFKALVERELEVVGFLGLD